MYKSYHESLTELLSQLLAVMQSILAIRSVAVGLGIVPADLDERSIQHIDKVRKQDQKASIRTQSR